jgi:hypothetical protein
MDSIGLQFTDPADNGTAWYWDYKEASDIPSPNSETYPAEIYVSLVVSSSSAQRATPERPVLLLYMKCYGGVL